MFEFCARSDCIAQVLLFSKLWNAGSSGATVRRRSIHLLRSLFNYSRLFDIKTPTLLFFREEIEIFLYHNLSRVMIIIVSDDAYCWLCVIWLPVCIFSSARAHTTWKIFYPSFPRTTDREMLGSSWERFARFSLLSYKFWNNFDLRFATFFRIESSRGCLEGLLKSFIRFFLDHQHIGFKILRVCPFYDGFGSFELCRNIFFSFGGLIPERRYFLWFFTIYVSFLKPLTWISLLFQQLLNFYPLFALLPIFFTLGTIMIWITFIGAIKRYLIIFFRNCLFIFYKVVYWNILTRFNPLLRTLWAPIRRRIIPTSKHIGHRHFLRWRCLHVLNRIRESFFSVWHFVHRLYPIRVNLLVILFVRTDMQGIVLLLACCWLNFLLSQHFLLQFFGIVYSVVIFLFFPLDVLAKRVDSLLKC